MKKQTFETAIKQLEDIVEKLEAVRGFLNEGIANYIRKNTEAGRTAIGPKNVKKILGENQIGKKGTIKVKSLDLNDNNQITFTIFGFFTFPFHSSLCSFDHL